LRPYRVGLTLTASIFHDGEHTIGEAKRFFASRRLEAKR
jgi:imidazole glycerol phosphate synthase subunit HisF